MTKPVLNPRAVITSGYGPRILNGKEDFHGGIDIAVPGNPRGVPVYVAIAGRIGGIVRDPSISCGYAFFIKPTDKKYNFFCCYMHLDSINPDLTEGEIVFEGQYLGVMGNTGASFGQHLHYGHRESMVPSPTFDPKEITALYT